MATLQCEIVTPERKFYSADADFVVLPAAEGEMGVLYQHEPVITNLKPGAVRVTNAETKDVEKYLVAGGYAQIDGKKVIILASRAAAAGEIDRDKVQLEMDEQKGKLSAMKDDDPNRAFTESEVEWAELLLANC